MTQSAQSIRTMLFAAGVIGLSAAPAVADVTTHALNLRSGPGLGHRVVAAMPAGARVNVGPCSGSWCRVSWRGTQGWASARYIGSGSAAPYAGPRREARREARADRTDGKFPVNLTRVYEPWYRSRDWFGNADWGRTGSDYSGPINYRSSWGGGAGW